MRNVSTSLALVCLMVGAGVSAGLVGGCSNQPGSGGGPGPMEPDEPDNLIELMELDRNPTAWELVADGVEDDGTISKAVALEAFALTFDAVPGVTPPEADTVGARCGSAALRWVSQHADSLTDEERAAIDAALGNDAARGATTSRTVQGEPSGERSCTVASPVFEDQAGAEQYRAILDQELDKLEDALGTSLGIPVYITLGTGASGKDNLAWASPQTSGSCDADFATSCRVELLTNREELNSEVELRAVISHELVHCFQATWLPANTALKRPDWLVEGFPDFAGEILNPGATRASFLVYTETPLRRLYTRTYDAQGFFFHLDTIGADVFGRIVAAFKENGSSAAFAHLIDGLGSDFGDTWASSYALDPSRGEAWHMPEAPPEAVSGMSMGTVVNGKSYLGNPGEAGTRISHLNFEADVLRFEVDGGMSGRISWDGGGESLLSEINGEVFCAKTEGCQCPEGSSGSPPQNPIPSSSAIVSVTGTTVNSSVEIFGVSLDEFCTKDAEPEPPPASGVDPCIVGNWVSNEWTLPGPTSDLNGRGGNGAVVRIGANGQAQWDFSSMQPITVYNEPIDVTTEEYSRGTASGRIAASDGSWDVSDTDRSNMEGFAIDSILGEYSIGSGPGIFVLLLDGGYTCSGNLLSYTTTDPVSELTVTVLLNRQ